MLKKEKIIKLSLDQLRDWNLCIVEHLSKGIPANFSEGMGLTILHVHSNKDIKGLRMITRDMNEWVDSLEKEMCQEIEKDLFMKFNEYI